MERASHPSRAQITALLDFLEKNPSLAKGFPKVPNLREKARKCWEELAFQLNSMGGCVKSWKQWTKYWADKKSAVKKKNTLLSLSLNATGNGAKMVIEISEIEEKILAIMSCEVSTKGDKPVEYHHIQTSAALESATSTSQEQNDIKMLPLLCPQFLDEDLPQTPTENIYSDNETSNLSDVVMLTDEKKKVDITCQELILPGSTLPHTSRSPNLPSKYSGLGDHSSRVPEHTQNVHRKAAISRNRPSPISTSSSRFRQRHQGKSPPSEKPSQYALIAERFLTLEGQLIEIDRQRLEIDRQRIEVDHQRNEVTAQALLSIGEGLKLLAEAVKK